MLEREMAKHQDQVAAEPSYAAGGACPSWGWPILPLGAGPVWIRAGPLHLPGGERPILTGTSILSQTWNPPPSSSFPPHLSLSFSWLQPALGFLRAPVPPPCCSARPSAHLGRAQGVVCWIGVRWRVGAGCRRPPADQLGPFTRLQWALGGQLASQLLGGGRGQRLPRVSWGDVAKQ